MKPQAGEPGKPQEDRPVRQAGGNVEPRRVGRPREQGLKPPDRPPGAILFLIRLFDALTDPLLGVVSDRTRTPMGRRRPYILTGSILLAAAMLFLFIPPQLPQHQATVWFAASLFALFLFWTVVTVPYEALEPEITSDYNERTSLFAVRDGLLIAGTLAAAAAPALVEALPGVATDRIIVSSHSGAPSSILPFQDSDLARSVPNMNAFSIDSVSSLTFPLSKMPNMACSPMT